MATTPGDSLGHVLEVALVAYGVFAEIDLLLALREAVGVGLALIVELGGSWSGGGGATGERRRCGVYETRNKRAEAPNALSGASSSANSSVKSSAGPAIVAFGAL